MKPDKLKKIKAKLDCPSTPEPEKEICRKLIKENPVDNSREGFEQGTLHRMNFSAGTTPDGIYHSGVRPQTIYDLRDELNLEEQYRQRRKIIEEQIRNANRNIPQDPPIFDPEDIEELAKWVRNKKDLEEHVKSVRSKNKGSFIGDLFGGLFR